MARIIRAIRLIVPWVARAFVAMVRSMLIALSSLWVGVPNSVHRMATDWQHRAISAGFPTEYDRLLYYILSTIAVLTILFGWIILAEVTVGLLRLIF